MDYPGRPEMESQVSLYERGRGKFDIHRRREGNVTTEAETGTMWPQVIKCWQRSDARRGKEQILTSRENMTLLAP